MEKLDNDEWLIGLSSWVIRDDNYPDFAVGQRRRFAAGFFADALDQAAQGTQRRERA